MEGTQGTRDQQLACMGPLGKQAWDAMAAEKSEYGQLTESPHNANQGQPSSESSGAAAAAATAADAAALQMAGDVYDNPNACIVKVLYMVSTPV